MKALHFNYVKIKRLIFLENKDNSGVRHEDYLFYLKTCSI